MELNKEEQIFGDFKKTSKHLEWQIILFLAAKKDFGLKVHDEIKGLMRNNSWMFESIRHPGINETYLVSEVIEFGQIILIAVENMHEHVALA